MNRFWWLLLSLFALGSCHRDEHHDPVARPAPAVDAAPSAEAVPARSAIEHAQAAPAASAETSPAGPCPPHRSCDYGAFADAKKRPTVTSILVQKNRHQLHLVAEGTIIRSYGVALGSGGLSQKMYEGDRVTPIGTYKITGRYPSKWHTYLALDYPNEVDVARHAEAVQRGEIPEGRGPGSAIAIHGHRQDQPSRLHKAFDWTLGCVSLDNDEIDEVANAVGVGTPVTIEP